MASWMRAPGHGGRLDRLAGLGLVAYHGSPHRFEKFSLQKIGTGEGAQAYGWGLYFASRREVADFYRQKLGGPDRHRRVLIDGVPEEEFYNRRSALPDVNAPSALNHIVYYVRLYKDANKGLAEAKRIAERTGDTEGNIAEARKLFAAHQVTVEPDERACCLYQVDIPEDDELLDYDKAIIHQPSGVISKLEAARLLPRRFGEWAGVIRREHAVHDYEIGKHPDIGPGEKSGDRDALANRLHRERLAIQQSMTSGRIRASDDGGWKLFAGEGVSPLTGRDLYRDVAYEPKLATEYLRAAGVPGLRYLDASSRGVGSGSYNYVIWDESRIGLKERLGG